VCSADLHVGGDLDSVRLEKQLHAHHTNLIWRHRIDLKPRSYLHSHSVANPHPYPNHSSPNCSFAYRISPLQTAIAWN
jgi:hypothetical protein